MNYSFAAGETFYERIAGEEGREGDKISVSSSSQREIFNEIQF